MKYSHIKIPYHLKDYIQSFWRLEDSSITPSPKALKTIADGCPGIIFQHSEKGIFYQNNKQLPTAFLYGQGTTHNTVHLSGQFSTIGIFFHPTALKTVFGLDANELTNSCVDLNTISVNQGFHLSEKLLNCVSINVQIETLSSFVFSQMQKNMKQVDERMQYALSKIIVSKGNISLKRLTETLNISERSFERKFNTYVGISPKLFSRICRFQTSLEQLKQNNFNKLSDIAFENEYADQSHFIRSFKEFAGVTPNQYQLQLYEAVENLATVMQ